MLAITASLFRRVMNKKDECRRTSVEGQERKEEERGTGAFLSSLLFSRKCRLLFPFKNKASQSLGAHWPCQVKLCHWTPAERSANQSLGDVLAGLVLLGFDTRPAVSFPHPSFKHRRWHPWCFSRNSKKEGTVSHSQAWESIRLNRCSGTALAFAAPEYTAGSGLRSHTATRIDPIRRASLHCGVQGKEYIKTAVFQ